MFLVVRKVCFKCSGMFFILMGWWWVLLNMVISLLLLVYIYMGFWSLMLCRVCMLGSLEDMV